MKESAAPALLSQATAPFASSSPLAEDLRERLYQFLVPLLTQLDRQIDVRLVRTFWQTIEAMIRFRNRAHGLLLSELGGYLLSPAHAPAGTKRLSNLLLLRCSAWAADLIDHFLWFLWQNALDRQQVLAQEKEPALLLWDQSALEKPESLHAEGLCAVYSVKAARLKRIKPGFYTPPSGRPVFVPGIAWIGLLLIGMAGPPTVAAMRWFSTRGKRATDERKVQYDLLIQCARSLGRTVLHVFDRGYAGAPWLAALSQYQARFLIRGPKHYHLLSPAHAGEAKAAWETAKGLPAWDERQLWDARKHRLVPVRVLALSVQHPHEGGPLWLVVARRGQGQEPWYLLTNEPITDYGCAARLADGAGVCAPLPN